MDKSHGLRTPQISNRRYTETYSALHFYIFGSLSVLFLGCSQPDVNKPTNSAPTREAQDSGKQLDSGSVQGQDSALMLPLDSEIMGGDLALNYDRAQPTEPVDQFATIADVGRDMSPTADMTISVSFECPSDANTSMCLFGETTRILENDENLEVSTLLVLNRENVNAQPHERPILRGFACDGIFFPMTLRDAIDLTDDGIQVKQIVHPASSRRFIWYRFYMGDTEVGFIFDEREQISAIIGDQDIHTCQVSIDS